MSKAFEEEFEKIRAEMTETNLLEHDDPLASLYTGMIMGHLIRRGVVISGTVNYPLLFEVKAMLVEMLTSRKQKQGEN